ncbi:MAG: serine dehydratase beta chain [Lachnospiraceae bacterium]
MNIFQMIGPVMIGPSSSHTAGAVRLGRVANKIMDGSRPAELRIELSGSFAKTYQGHGTDRALLAGIMGVHSYSEEIRDALRIAEERGIRYEFVPVSIAGAHPNTARIHFRCEDGSSGVVQGASIGGGKYPRGLCERAPGGLHRGAHDHTGAASRQTGRDCGCHKSDA